MNAYSQDLRDRAIKLYLTGNYTKKSLSELLSVDYKTLRSWITLYETTGYCKFTHINNLVYIDETGIDNNMSKLRG